MGGYCPKQLLQNCTLDDRKNEVNGSNHEMNPKISFFFVISQGLKKLDFPTSWKISLRAGGVCKKLTFPVRGEGQQEFY